MREYLPYITTVMSVLSLILSILSFGFLIFKYNKIEKHRFSPPKKAVYPHRK